MCQVSDSSGLLTHFKDFREDDAVKRILPELSENGGTRRALLNLPAMAASTILYDTKDGNGIQAF